MKFGILGAGAVGGMLRLAGGLPDRALDGPALKLGKANKITPKREIATTRKIATTRRL